MTLTVTILVSSVCFLSSEEQHGSKQHRKREGKRPDLQRYQPVAGHGPGRRHRDSEEGESGFVHEHEKPLQGEKKAASENVSDFTDSGTATEKMEEDRMRGDSGNRQNCRKSSHPQVKVEANQEKGSVENHRDQEPVGASKPTKKARKPDREFYQPGSRRNIQGKDCAVGREQDRPPPRKHEQKTEMENQVSAGEIEGNKKPSTPKRGVKGKEAKGTQENVKLTKSSEINRNQGNQDVQKPPLPSDPSVEKMTSKMEKLGVKEKGKVGCQGQDSEELSCRKGQMSDKGKRGQGGGAKDEEEKQEKKKEKGNRKRRGGEKEKERNQDSRRGGDDVSSRMKNDQGRGEKERDRRTADADNRPAKTGEKQQNKGRENCRESRRGDNNNNNRPREMDKDDKTGRHADSTVVDRNKSSANMTSSKRYSKSDIRRSRHRTYSSSSTSSVTSLDGPGLGLDAESTKWSRLQPKHNNKEEIGNGEEGRRSHLKSWTTNEESSTESLEGSEVNDLAVDRRRRRRGGEEELNAMRRREERNRPKGTKGGGRGILRVSLEKQSGTSSHSGGAQHCKQVLAPRGRGGGILVLPARTDISNSPEVGQRLLFGGIRGGATCSSRGGRGGGVRRLWDPNNPDQKPALTGTQSQHKSLQQPIYLQTGTGYGQLHFLDTDDEVAGSPPVPQGEHIRQQAAAMAYYKFQNSDNPYCYPMPTAPGTATSQRYPYPYHMGPYQVAPPNGVYSGPGGGQFCASYRGGGYSQQSGGGGLTFEEAEQQARGELGRVLRAADAQELQLSNLLSRDRVSADGLDRMTQLR